MHWGDSEATDVMTFLNGQLPVNSAETTFLYGFGGWSRRTGSHGGNYRRGLDANNWPQIYPLGFLPLIEPRDRRRLRHPGPARREGEWFWDLPAQYGHNRLDYHVADSLNASLGPDRSRPTTPTSTRVLWSSTRSWPTWTSRARSTWGWPRP